MSTPDGEDRTVGSPASRIDRPGSWVAPGQPPIPAQPGYPGYPTGYAPGDFSGYGYGYPYPVTTVIPRPPRPRVVGLAVGLTWIGIALSGVAAVVDLVMARRYYDEILAESVATGDVPPPPGFETVIGATVTVGVVLGLVMWLLPAAGVATCAVLARRGNNPARIVFAALVGVIALSQICGAGAGFVTLAMPNMVGGETFDTAPPALQAWQTASAGVDAALGVLAAAICVLVLVPPANRFFSPGPGRRFAPQV